MLPRTGPEESQSTTLRRTSGFPHSVGEVLIVALWFGLFGGLLEGVAHWIYQATPVLSITERLHPVDLNILWASPLIDTLLFVTIACFLLPIFFLLRKYNWQLPTIVFTALVCNALLVGTGRVRMRGAAVFAVGVGTVAGRWMRRDPSAVMAFFRRSLLPLFCVALLTCGAVRIGNSVWQKVQIARLPSAPPGAPNVLLIVLDTLRADRLSTYGYSRATTPFLDEYAHHGVLFEKAFADSSWTMPSHTSLFTGRFPFQHGVYLWPYDDRFPTLAQVLAAHGYVTAGFSSNEWPCTRASGLGVGFTDCESIFNGPLDTFLRSFYGRRFAENANTMRGARLSAEDINGRFLDWLDHRPKRPFFAFLNYMEVHETYHPPIEYAARFSSDPEAVNQGGRGRAGKTQLIPEAYDASLAYLDAQLQRLASELSRRELDKNLLVIITGDHGQSLGEHGLMASHGSNLHLEQIHVPLVMVWPGRIPAGLRLSDVVGLQTVPGTISDLASLNKNAFPGGSLTGCWTGGRCGDGLVLSELTLPQNPTHRSIWMKSLITSDRHFILERDGTVELYDWKSDPQETINLADAEIESSLVETLGTKLAEIVPEAAAAWAAHTGKAPVAAR